MHVIVWKSLLGKYLSNFSASVGTEVETNYSISFLNLCNRLVIGICNNCWQYKFIGSAVEITDLLIPEIEAKNADFICLNYANTDMVGHTGVFSAAIKAAETVDACVKRVVTAGIAADYTIFLTADHGNADFMINEDGSPNTAHTLNPVPLFIIDNEWSGLIQPGKLGDIAPTILNMMKIPIPAEMTGNVLI